MRKQLPILLVTVLVVGSGCTTTDEAGDELTTTSITSLISTEQSASATGTRDPACAQFAVEILDVALEALEIVLDSAESVEQWFEGEIRDAAVVRRLDRLVDDLRELSRDVAAMGPPPPSQTFITEQISDGLEAFEDAFHGLGRAIERGDADEFDEAMSDLDDATNLIESESSEPCPIEN